MVNPKDSILEQARRAGVAKPSAGLTVPEGYFDDFCAELEQSLPERPEIERAGYADEQEAPRTLRQKVRAYVYMAAMFAGIWCMLQMFASIGSFRSLQPMGDNPVLAKALASDAFMRDYIYDDLNAWELVDEMIDEGSINEDGEFLEEEPEIQLDTESVSDYILPE